MAQLLLAGTIAAIGYVMGRMSGPSGVGGSNEPDFEGMCDGMGEEYEGDAEKHMRNSITMSDPMFSRVENGSKTIEVRVGGPTKFQDMIGKELAFYNPATKESITVTISKVDHFPDLDTLASKINVDQALGVKGKASDLVQTYGPYCKPEIVDRVGGVVAMHIKFVRRGK